MSPHDPTFNEGRGWQLLAWAGAVAGLLAAFWHDWTVPWLGTDLRTKPGHVLIEAQEAVQAALLGSLLGGTWGRVVRRGRRFGSAGLLLLGGAAWTPWLPALAFWAFLAVWAGWLVLSFLGRFEVLGKALGAFWRRREPWNAAFCVLWVLIGTACDAALLREAPAGPGAAADCLLARFLTHLILATGVWALLTAHNRLVPAPGRWMAWSVVATAPLLVVVNTWLQLWWGKGMVEMFGELEVGGRFELERAWAAGGVEWNAGTALRLLGTGLAVVAVTSFCAWFSRQRGWRASPRRLVWLGAAAWLALQVDQLAGSVLKDREWLWWERKTYPRRMTWLEPAPGLRGFDAVFQNPKVPVAPQPLRTKPDVFFFMVESLRADALKPEIAPFLCRFRDEACQPLGETWAASNVTHQSWFSILSGRLPLFFNEGREEKRMLALPAVLKASGYRVETRLVNDFSYMEMVQTNFGHPTEADVMEHVNRDSSENFFKVPEREARLLDRLKNSVLSRAAGGLLAISGLDATHYNYKWGTRFQPPFADFEQNPIFPMRPDADEVRRIVNRYWNSVAWVDAQLAEFISWLKAQGRYDDAIVIITGDHGEEFKEQGSWFHGTMLNEPQTRVPILIKWPQSMSQGRGPEVARASHLDLLPTLLDALGGDPALWRDLPGISLLHPPAGDRTLVLTTHFCGKNGQAMLLLRGHAQAAFGWRDFWQPIVPRQIWLERVKNVPGMHLEPAFGDALPRVFQKLTPEAGEGR
jgi:hypothetical protein